MQITVSPQVQALPPKIQGHAPVCSGEFKEVLGGLTAPAHHTLLAPMGKPSANHTAPDRPDFPEPPTVHATDQIRIQPDPNHIPIADQRALQDPWSATPLTGFLAHRIDAAQALQLPELSADRGASPAPKDEHNGDATLPDEGSFCLNTPAKAPASTAQHLPSTGVATPLAQRQAFDRPPLTQAMMQAASPQTPQHIALTSPDSIPTPAATQPHSVGLGHPHIDPIDALKSAVALPNPAATNDRPPDDLRPRVTEIDAQSTAAQPVNTDDLGSSPAQPAELSRPASNVGASSRKTPADPRPLHQESSKLPTQRIEYVGPAKPTQTSNPPVLTKGETAAQTVVSNQTMLPEPVTAPPKPSVAAQPVARQTRASDVSTPRALGAQAINVAAHVGQDRQAPMPFLAEQLDPSTLTFDALPSQGVNGSDAQPPAPQHQAITTHPAPFPPAPILPASDENGAPRANAMSANSGLATALTVYAPPVDASLQSRVGPTKAPLTVSTGLPKPLGASGILAPPHTVLSGKAVQIAPLPQISVIADAVLNTAPPPLDRDPVLPLGLSPSPTVVPATSAALPVAPQQVTQTIVQSIKMGVHGPIELTLRPEELGQLRFEISTLGDKLHVTLFVERADAMDLMRRHGDQLLNDLRLNGFNQPSLSFADWSQRNARSGASSKATATAEASFQDGAVATVEAPQQTSTAGRLDLRL